MFSPSREQVRQFFIETWKKQRNQQVLTPMEQMAADIISWHPEYQELLSQPDAIQHDFTIEKGQTNPFLHMSMHLAIQEQLSVDQPPGIRLAYQGLLKRCDEHEAQHRIMEALGEVVWEAQRLGTPLDNERYLELIRRHTS